MDSRRRNTASTPCSHQIKPFGTSSSRPTCCTTTGLIVKFMTSFLTLHTQSGISVSLLAGEGLQTVLATEKPSEVSMTVASLETVSKFAGKVSAELCTTSGAQE